MTQTRSQTTAEEMLAFTIEAAQLLADRKCEDVKLLDVRGLSQVCDYTLIASGTSERQMKSIGEELKSLGREQGIPIFRSAVDDGHTWVVIDFVDTVVHLFEPEHREYYDLESLWQDATEIDWQRDE